MIKIRIITFVFSCSIFVSSSIIAQLYTEAQTRHRFAQMTLGVDYQTNFGGSTNYLDSNGQMLSAELPQFHRPRFLIGGTHFWGHADFYIAILLTNPSETINNQDISFTSGVETVFKYYPWKVKHQGVRPFVGVSLTSYYFEQSNGFLQYGDGPDMNHTSWPIQAGLTYNYNQHILDASLTWNYANEQDYYISPDVETQINTAPLYLSVGYKFMFDTTIGAEKDWESGRTDEVTKILADRGILSGFYLGAGMSSAFWLKQSPYNKENRPYVKRPSNSLMPDFTLGYYNHKRDFNLAVSYRGFGTSSESYGARQSLRRRSLGLEFTKNIFDYHGFVPFIGPIVSYEALRFQEAFETGPLLEEFDNQVRVGCTVGWDIRPNRIQTWLLRTNLRYYPSMNLDLPELGSSVAFDAIEFNFIQLIIYPSRMF